MGGYGSGRHWHFSAKNTTDDFRALDIRRLAREGLLTPGQFYGWQWSIDGEKVASIQVKVENWASLRLIYKTRGVGGDWRDMNYPVLLDHTPCHLGGQRAWFLCPAHGCGKRVAKLYGGEIFACRRCHDLTYASQREHPSDRAARRCERIRQHLGWGGGIFDPPGPKPKGMQWRTFDRLSSEAHQAAHQANHLASARFLNNPTIAKMLNEIEL